ncbi:transposon Ty3-I Gag-Pol polyprotein [Trichonephila clavata]|uniref:Transposon Ty3-I Gag-Pol polyprotein n=1 Tax=Trichonephila clavata TaxID=2740835 RepID=A0A8X6LMY8_TRICU|nr:transposon Ty3-I Gag-Pol polyprotein [Trichonephila clavata]
MSGNHLDVTIDGLPVKALVDSGASSSVISEKFRRYLKKVMFPAHNHTVLKVANGSYIQPKASGALIDSGQSELTLDDVEVTSEEVVLKPLSLCVMKDCRLPAYSIMKIPVVNHYTEDSGNVIVKGSNLLALKKEVFMPSVLITLRRGKTEIWVVNEQSQEKVIPQGMCVAFAEPFCPDCIATIFETSRVPTEISETKQSFEFRQRAYTNLTLCLSGCATLRPHSSG